MGEHVPQVTKAIIIIKEHKEEVRYKSRIIKR